MLIDFITTCSSIVKVSDYNSISGNMLSNNYTLKTLNDIKSWKLTNDSVSAVSFNIISPNVKKLKEIDYNLVGSLQNADIITKIETSLDYMNWAELDYVETISGDTHIYKKLRTELGLYYFDISTGALYSESEIDTTNLTYTFKKFNEYSKEYSYVYDNLEWKFLRISFSNITGTALNPLFFTHLKIYIEEDFDDNSIDKNLLEFKSSMFVKSKMYEEFEFFPDIIRNYLVMLEDKNNMHDSRNFINVNVCHDFVSPYPDPEGIGNDIVGYDTVVYT